MNASAIGVAPEFSLLLGTPKRCLTVSGFNVPEETLEALLQAIMENHEFSAGAQINLKIELLVYAGGSRPDVELNAVDVQEVTSLDVREEAGTLQLVR